MSTKSSNLDSIIAEKLADSILLQSIDPLVDKIRIFVTDYILELKKTLSTPGELTTVSKAAKIISVHPNTIYRWIDNGVITCYYIESFRIVSITEVKNVYEQLYNIKMSRYKNRDSIKQSNNSIESL
jgi:hypothetical protein